MLTLREATEAPTQGSRSSLSTTEVTELATVRLFLILSAFLCSLRPGFCIVCDFAHARPIMLQHSTSLRGERERAPSCGFNGRAVTIDIYIDRRAYVHRYCACAALRANVGGQIGNVITVRSINIVLGECYALWGERERRAVVSVSNLRCWLSESCCRRSSLSCVISAFNLRLWLML